MSEPVKVEFAYPSVKEQTKQAFLGTAIGLAPFALLWGGVVAWAKIAEKRAAKNPVVEQTEETTE